MSIYMDRAKKVRAITERHYNCAQSVLVAFHDVIGLDEEQAYQREGGRSAQDALRRAGF